MTKKQEDILDVWNTYVDDEMSTEYAIQYVANLTGSTYAEVVRALTATGTFKEVVNE